MNARQSASSISSGSGANVWVVQRRRRFGLPLKPGERLRVVSEVVGQELQRDVATKLEVFGLIDNAHAPPADFVEYAVMGRRYCPRGWEGVAMH